MRIVKVAVEKTVYHFDKDFDYAVPDALVSRAMPGCRVRIPFGTANRVCQGMILSVRDAEGDAKIKFLQAVLDEAPLLSDEMLFMVPWLKERYFCTLFDAVKLLLPAGLTYRVRKLYTLAAGVTKEQILSLPADERNAVLPLLQKPQQERNALLREAGLPPDAEVLERLCKKEILHCTADTVRRVGDASQKMVRLCSSLPEPLKLTPRQREVFKVLQDAGCASVKEVCYFTGVTPAVIKNMTKHGVCETYEQETYRTPYLDAETSETGLQEPISLSSEQHIAYEHLYESYQTGKASVSLLYGVTGSGKTNVYLCLIDKVLADGRNVILMVPEISLTPQSVRIFQRRYGRRVAVFHSGLSVGERMDEWKRVKRGEAAVVVGTRSAVFAPLPHLGLVIVDEEQESTYQSESSPRYHAKEVAWFRCRYHKALLLLASATPCVETYYAARTGKIGLEILEHRYGEAKLPQVCICDMNRELQDGNTTMLSRPLLEALHENLRQKRQSILLLNRRGYNTFASCPDCGYVMTCPNCSISLTYHAANHRLMCHYCGYSVPFTAECPSCHSRHMRYAGAGTQRAEEQLQEMLPQARILRLDADAAMRRYAYEEKLHQFAEGAYDLIVGTQMVAKGLDFENVTVVGVLSADQSLYSDDFRSTERTFDLLTQVIGRAGRGRFCGRAFLQTFTPENPVFALAARQDYPSFYEQELPLRKVMLYPPFSDLCVVGFVSAEERAAREGSIQFLRSLQEAAQKMYRQLPLRVLNPSPARIYRAGGKYRYKLLLKCRNSTLFRQMLAQLLSEFAKSRIGKAVTAFADINPENIL
ncbi:MULTISPECIES: replication restart helicase PriA [Caproicibacterium]|uniref:Replication restart protein PriA n=1 Tax=Caproicibacterium argilliputei TaxID=3030016 RepID=A0AA97D7P8_9FIRM|nr:primosomal protein N' [Caproicibacterium argilliputei]WOC31042.1 primosomal protein N' [Caproicibacterium argilliputei]